jgi:Rps23 Pro-64 3,4-dihydroxylase Tpa1-like proline 4-hydroxylase
MSLAAGTEARITASPPDGAVDVRCPYLLYRDVMGQDYVTGLLKHVVERQGDFVAGNMHNRQTGESFMDRKVRWSLYLKDLGPFRDPIKAFVKTIASPALKALNLIEPLVKPREFEITAYPDGGHIGEHIDTKTETKSVRILSCVYYFAATPRRFDGGELRLFGFPKRLGPGDISAPASFVDIEPRTNTLVIFPSWLRHQVLPVRVPSGAWSDARFTINCWVHRVGSSRAP